MKLDMKALTLSFGVTWAISMAFMGWVASFGWGVAFVHVMASVYTGYGASFIGGIIGAIWGFVDGAIVGFLVSLFYNLFHGNKK